METRLERIEKNRVTLEIEVESERLERALNRVYREMAARVNIPGFRRGKVPRPVLEAYLGKEVLVEQACEEIVPEALEQAVKESGIEPVSEPKIELVQTEQGKPLIFKADFVVKPEVKLGRLEGIEVEVPDYQVTEADVEARLELMRERYAKLVTLDGEAEAQLGDVVNIDFEGFIAGEPFPGGSGQGYSLELGSGAFIPGFEEQLVGAKTGEQKEVKVTFPGDYHVEELRNKEAVFTVRVNEIKRKELAPLNDEFAQDVSEFSTLEELKQDIRKNLEELAEARKKQDIKDKVLSKAAQEAEVDIPEEMIQNQLDYLLQEFERRLLYQGIRLEDYLSITGTNLEELRESFLPDAEKTVREALVLEAAAKQLDLKVDEEDLEKEIQEFAKLGVSSDGVRERLQEEATRSRVEKRILLDKAADYLVQRAVIKAPEEQGKEAETEKTE